MNQRLQCGLVTAVIATSFLTILGCSFKQPPAPTRSRDVPSTATAPMDIDFQPGGQWLSNRYTDLPIPNAYRYKPDESFVFEQQGRRSADLRYEGDLSVEDLIRFYQESMPTNGWNFLRLTGVRMKTLTFTRQGEICEIIIMSVQPSSTADAQREQKSGWSEPSPVSTHLHIKVNRS